MGKIFPPKIVWLEPHCDECYSGCYGDGPSWCEDDVFEPCEKCGMEPTKYVPEPQPTGGGE